MLSAGSVWFAMMPAIGRTDRLKIIKARKKERLLSFVVGSLPKIKLKGIPTN